MIAIARLNTARAAETVVRAFNDDRKAVRWTAAEALPLVNREDVICETSWKEIIPDECVYAGRADLHRSRCEYEKSLRFIEKAIVSSRTPWIEQHLWNAKGLLLTYLGESDKAVEAYGKSARPNTKGLAYWYNLAVATVTAENGQDATNMTCTARRHLRGAVFSDPAEAYYGLVDCLHSKVNIPRLQEC